MVKRIDPGTFNYSDRKPGYKHKAKPHEVVEYKAAADFVLCNCGESFTARGYNDHSRKMRTAGWQRNGRLAVMINVDQEEFSTRGSLSVEVTSKSTYVE
jgi:hypothetical protein